MKPAITIADRNSKASTNWKLSIKPRPAAKTEGKGVLADKRSYVAGVDDHALSNYQHNGNTYAQQGVRTLPRRTPKATMQTQAPQQGQTV